MAEMERQNGGGEIPAADPKRLELRAALQRLERLQRNALEFNAKTGLRKMRESTQAIEFLATSKGGEMLDEILAAVRIREKELERQFREIQLAEAAGQALRRQIEGTSLEERRESILKEWNASRQNEAADDALAREAAGIVSSIESETRAGEEWKEWRKRCETDAKNAADDAWRDVQRLNDAAAPLIREFKKAQMKWRLAIDALQMQRARKRDASNSDGENSTQRGQGK